MKKKIVPILSVIVLVMMACNAPGIIQPTAEFQTPTPNLTLTALFSQEEIIKQTVEAIPKDPPTAEAPQVTQPPVVTLTPVPTDTVVAATATSTTAPTNTAVSERPGGTFIASYVSTPPVMDGVWDEWTARAYPAKFVVYGYDNWDGKEDLEGSFRVAWDGTYLYIAAKVIDDTYVQNTVGRGTWEGDSIEILFDRDLVGDFSSTALSGDDFQLGVTLGKAGEEDKESAYLWYPADQAGTKTGLKIAGVRSEGVYRMEVAIPWSMFNVSASQGMRFGFAFSASDNDNNNANNQESMVSAVQTRSLTNPTTWGQLVLGN
jgi:hypothetical protein